MVNDPVGDMIIRLKNSSIAGKTDVRIPYSNLKFEIAKLLAKEGYLESVDKKGRKIKKSLLIKLAKKDNGQPRIKNVARISKPSLRIYRKARELKPFIIKNGLLILSTPNGIVSHKDVESGNIGGEVLFKIY